MRPPINFKPAGRIFRVTRGLLLVLMLASAAAAAQTQITTGVIQGTVEDEQGATVPGASVEVRNVETNLTKTLATDDDGRFVFLQLPPGRYTLTASKQGFATLKQEEFTLTVGQAANLDLQMKVSGVNETITVSAVQTIDTASTQTSTTLDERAVGNLPVLGRKFEDLLTLTPNVSITQGPDGDEINFAGQRGVFNNISLDGGDYMNGFFGEQAGGQRAAIDIPLDAVKEFQVVATGATAEFGRTAGGVVNVVTKSGTNEFHGSLFHFQRLEALTANTSDGRPLTDFHREQFGGNVGGPIKKDKAFFFVAYEQIFENLTRANLSEQVGDTPCPVSAPTIVANEALINANADCQRLALLNFFRTTRNQEEGLPIERPIRNSAILGKFDFELTQNNHLTLSHNFDHSKNENQTFDVPTYGNSANGTEGPSKIHAFNAQPLLDRLADEGQRVPLHLRARGAAARGHAVEHPRRHGDGRLLLDDRADVPLRQPLLPRPQRGRDLLARAVQGQLLHRRRQPHDEVRRRVAAQPQLAGLPGLLPGALHLRQRDGLPPLRLAREPRRGLRPRRRALPRRHVHYACARALRARATGGPLLLYLQGAGPNGPATDAAGASDIKNEDLALFAQDKWQVRPNLTLNYGLRWEAQIFPEPEVPPAQTAYGIFLNDPRFPSDGTLHSPKKQFQPRVGFAWDVRATAGRCCARATASTTRARTCCRRSARSRRTASSSRRSAGGAFANPTVPAPCGRGW